MDGYESILRFLLLPSEVFVVLLLEFLNSFRSFGLRFVLYNYITNEFGIGDTHAGALLGVKGFVDIAFGLAGSILVDIFGVRRVSIVALSVAIVGRTLLAFGRTKMALYSALFLFSPCGDALLSVGLYKVALKKLTTPLTRPLAFAMSYASFNLAGAFADILVDKMRGGLEDLNVDQHFVGVAGVYTPLRQFVVSLSSYTSNGNHCIITFWCGEQVVTWIVVLLTWIIAYSFLEDWTVIDPNDPEDNDHIQQQRTSEMNETSMSETETDGHEDSFADDLINSTPAKPMVKPHILRRWFPNLYQSHHAEDEIHFQEGNVEGAPSRRLPNYKMYRTQYTGSNEGNISFCAGLVQMFNQVIELLKMRSTWRVLIFGFASMTIAMNWTASEMVLPPFLERRFGEQIPIYTIQSINLFGCLILPPIIGAVTSGREDFSIVMPGLWIMATSSIFVAIFPNAAGACVWQVFMTIGEVLWSPRQVSWTASLAPTGSEGLFFAVSSARSVMGPLTDILMGAINEKYNTNCPDCRDQYGHFCSIASANDDAIQCSSVQGTCDLVLDNTQQSECPSTCVSCPSWEPTDPSTCWYLLMLASMLTPISVWFFLPFLRGKHNRDDKCYGLFSLTKNRFFGICGAVDDTGPRVDVRHVIYGHVESEGFDSETKRGDVKAHGDDVELT
ncbi:hypothetical protein ACHAXR_012483 [Thalassiosira sp. AJA248-18]